MMSLALATVALTSINVSCSPSPSAAPSTSRQSTQPRPDLRPRATGQEGTTRARTRKLPGPRRSVHAPAVTLVPPSSIAPVVELAPRPSDLDIQVIRLSRQLS